MYKVTAYNIKNTLLKKAAVMAHPLFVHHCKVIFWCAVLDYNKDVLLHIS